MQSSAKGGGDRIRGVEDTRLFGEDAPRGDVKPPRAAKDKSPQPKRAKKPSFEEKYQRLERILDGIEREDLPLEQLISLFEEGVGLIRECSSYLQEARLVIESHLDDDGGLHTISGLKDDAEE